MSAASDEIEVLIVGAGPTGLVLALCLMRFGVRLRIIDTSREPGTTSRAVVVHARTLEFYRQLGIADGIVEAAQKFLAVNLWVKGRRRARIEFGDIGGALSAYPYSLIFPQDEHERKLIDVLRQGGVEVERGIEASDITTQSDRVVTSLRHADGTVERCESYYLAGCDGAHSAVRAKLGIALPGGTYSQLWYVADVEASGPFANEEVNIAMEGRDVLAVFPMKGAGGARLVGQATDAGDADSVLWESVNTRLVQQLRTQVKKVKWFSTYRVHHRVADRFRKGRAFLLGDAAHLHSPVGGQGMNTGIGDAVNAAWKLHSVLRHQSHEALLDSYEPERIAFARRLVATTDAVFAMLNSKSPLARFIRTSLVPTVMPQLLRSEGVRRFAFRMLSQISVRYRQSWLSRGRVAGVYGGDRLPWVSTLGDPSGFEDNFAPLNSLQWQAHVYGEVPAPLRTACETLRLTLREFVWQDRMRRAGLVRNALYLVRPDEHVALANEAADAAVLERFLRERIRQSTANACSF